MRVENVPLSDLQNEIVLTIADYVGNLPVLFDNSQVIMNCFLVIERLLRSTSKSIPLYSYVVEQAESSMNIGNYLVNSRYFVRSQPCWCCNIHCSTSISGP